MKVITSGSAYLDIDAYAGCIAYAELLNLQGEQAVAASTAIWNESITPTIRMWPTELQTTYQANADDTFVIIDLSELRYFDTFVDPQRVVEVIDHHPGFEDYWQERIGKGANIEFIGAACTLVYERWQQAGLLDQMSSTSARLLSAGILDNTLKFLAGVTSERDKKAYAELVKHADLDDDWPAQYFGECQQSMLKNIAKALQTDTKTAHYPSLDHAIDAGQLVVWDAAEIITNHMQTIQETMNLSGPEWFVNIVSISEGKSYLLAADLNVQKFLERALAVLFKDHVAVADRLWLRKEIMKQDISMAAKRTET